MRIADGLRIRSGDVVTLVGGGGKTTVMFRLAEELTAAGLTVISTMTTKIFVEQMARAPASLLLRDDGSVPPELAELLDKHRHVLLGGRIAPAGGGLDREKLEGVPPEIADQLAAARVADVIIVEGDGSRRMPLKAPADHEPVVSQSTTVLVPLVGLEVLGQPLDASHVHRPQRVAELARANLGEAVSVRTVARVLRHPQGGAKGLPSAARFVPFLNKADLNMDGGRELARALLVDQGETEQGLAASGGITRDRAVVVDEVIIGAAESAEPVRESWGHVAAVVLAAGEAKRFGSLKQVMPWHGASPGVTVPLVVHVARQALACPAVAGVVVTVGAQGELVEAALTQVLDRTEQVLRVAVSNWIEGQSRSVR
ncbi:MAG: selenium cofactor biosynthesis protein YqeC, partial [Nitrososphaerales archaeon]